MPTVERRQQHRFITWLDRRGIWLILLIAGVCYALSFNPRLSGTDDATYLVTAQALAAGEGFCKANLAGCPPETYYPHGFPLILAPFVAVLPGWPYNVPLLVLIPMAFALLSLPVVYHLLKRQLDVFPLPLVITLALAVNYVGTWFTFTLMAETLYTFVSVAALLALDRAENSIKPLRYYALAGMLIGSVALVRSVGFALLGSAVFYLLLRRQWKYAAIVLALATVFVGPVLLRGYLVTHSPTWAPYRGVFINSYLDTFLQKHWQDTTLGQATLADLGQRLLVNVKGHATGTLPKLFFPTLESPRLHRFLQPLHLNWVVPTFSWLVAGAVVAGFGLRLRQRLRPLDLYVLFYLGMILLPGWYTFRNLVPILAFTYLYVAWFLRSIPKAIAALFRGRRLAAHLGLALPVMFVLLSALSNSLSMVGTNFVMGVRYRASGFQYVEAPSFVEACHWIGEDTQPDDLVVYCSSEKMFLCSGRQAPPSLSTMPVSLNARDHAAVIQSVYQEADFVLVTTTDVVDPPLTNSEPIAWESTYFLHPILEQDTESFALRYETTQSPAVRIYQVLR